jgi:hypothetical protein
MLEFQCTSCGSVKCSCASVLQSCAIAGVAPAIMEAHPITSIASKRPQCVFMEDSLFTSDSDFCVSSIA